MPLLTAAPTQAMAAHAREAWRWWTGELAAALPALARSRRKPRPRCDIRVSPGGVAIDRVADGVGERFFEQRQIGELDEAAWAQLAAVTAGTRVRLLLTVPDVYWTQISLPAAARGRLRPAVALQLPQIAPLQPASLVWAAEPVAADRERITVAVAMARAVRLDALEALFRDNGLAVPPIAAEAGDRIVELTAGDGIEADPQRRLNRRLAIAAALLLASIPFTTLAAAHFLTGITQSRIAAVEGAVAPRMEAERRAARSAEAARALQRVFAYPSPSETLEALALALPDTDHATAAARGPSGVLTVEVDSADPEALQAQIDGSAPLAGLAASDPAPAPDKPGRSAVQLRGAGQ